MTQLNSPQAWQEYVKVLYDIHEQHPLTNPRGSHSWEFTFFYSTKGRDAIHRLLFRKCQDHDRLLGEHFICNVKFSPQNGQNVP